MSAGPSSHHAPNLHRRLNAAVPGWRSPTGDGVTRRATGGWMTGATNLA
jgi:hypothetical protein